MLRFVVSLVLCPGRSGVRKCPSVAAGGKTAVAMRRQTGSFSGALTGLLGLSPYIHDRITGISEFNEFTVTPQAHIMESIMGKVNMHLTTLRQCREIIEASVLGLGVPTAHQLITYLTDVGDTLSEASTSWNTILVTRKEEWKLLDELMHSITRGYNTLRDKHDAMEREVQRLLGERSRIYAALDDAIKDVEVARLELTQKPRVRPEDLEDHSPAESLMEVDQWTHVLESLLHAKQETSSTGAGADGSIIIRCGAPPANEALALQSKWKDSKSLREMSSPTLTKHTPGALGVEVNLFHTLVAMSQRRDPLSCRTPEEMAVLEQSASDFVKGCREGRRKLLELKNDLQRFKLELISMRSNGSPFAQCKNVLQEALQHRPDSGAS